MVRPCRQYLGPYTKDEHAKYLQIQNGQRRNRVAIALGVDLPARVHPEQMPDQKKKKKKKTKPPSDDDDEDVEIEDHEVADDTDDNEGHEENEGNEVDDEEEEEHSSSDNDSDSSSSDSSSDSSASETAKTVPPPAVSKVQKRKELSSSPLPELNPKRVHIVDLSDDELDEGEIRIGVPILTVTPIRADASFAVMAKDSEPLKVLATAAAIAEDKGEKGKAVESDKAGPKADGSGSQSVPEKDVRAADSSKTSEPSSPPFISTPSPELIKDVLSGFSDRCAKSGHWLMGLPNFNDLGESSGHGENICLNDLKYRYPLCSIGDKLEKSLISPELEK